MKTPTLFTCSTLGMLAFAIAGALVPAIACAAVAGIAARTVMAGGTK